MGVNYADIEDETIDTSLPYACGGEPFTVLYLGNIGTFSPRTWGCTDCFALYDCGDYTFPTHVGVNRADIEDETIDISFPYACGGVLTATLLR